MAYLPSPTNHAPQGTCMGSKRLSSGGGQSLGHGLAESLMAAGGCPWGRSSMSKPQARLLPWCLCHQEVVGVWKAPTHTPLRALEFQNGSKANVPQALTEKKPQGQVGEGAAAAPHGPQDRQSLSCLQGRREQGQKKPPEILSSTKTDQPVTSDPQHQPRPGSL